MKFTVLTPALLAALAASANAATYQLNDATSCVILANKFSCSGKTTEATCTGDCEWEADAEMCGIKAADDTKFQADADTLAEEFEAIDTTCEAKAEAECTGDCAWGSDFGDEGIVGICVPSEAKTASILASVAAPIGLEAENEVDNFGLINCRAKTTESTCEAVDGCQFMSFGDMSVCSYSYDKAIGELSAACGSNGDWDAAATAANTTVAAAQAAAGTDTASGAADSASRFAVLAASAVAAASLLA